MTPKDFCYWLQGYFELEGGGSALDERKIEIIKDHLKLVFNKETSDVPTDPRYTLLVPQMVPTGPFYYESIKHTNPTITYVGDQPGC
jgi:hypothetical protein